MIFFEQILYYWFCECMSYKDEARQERMGFQWGKEIKYQNICFFLFNNPHSIPRGPKEGEYIFLL